MCTHKRHRFDRRDILAALPAAALMAGLPTGPAHASAAKIDLPAPGPRDVCPVCGMFVAKYREWVATVLWDDGEAVHFDGAKDFFKFLRNLEKYAPGRNSDQIAGMGVTEYYGLSLIDAKEARYVIGSDVYGPMGHELVPLASEVDSADFLKDHKGKSEIAFGDVEMGMLTNLDAGKFE